VSASRLLVQLYRFANNHPSESYSERYSAQHTRFAGGERAPCFLNEERLHKGVALGIPDKRQTSGSAVSRALTDGMHGNGDSSVIMVVKGRLHKRGFWPTTGVVKDERFRLLRDFRLLCRGGRQRC
jgi:hypothetical protein